MDHIVDRGQLADRPLPDRPRPDRPLATRLRDWVEWFGLARLVVTALSVGAVGAGGYWLLRPVPAPVESSLPRAVPASGDNSSGVPAASAAAGSATATGSTVVAGADGSTESTLPLVIVVHVAGAVVSPGVYSLAADARVVDAVSAAGGVTADARADAVNLAAPMNDGDRVYLPTQAEAPTVPVGVSGATPTAAAPTDSGVSPAAVVIDLNIASVDQLDGLPGVGPSTAAAIVAHREANGPFSSVDALDDVRGIGPAKLDSLRTLVTV